MVMPTQANGLSNEDPVQGLLHKGPAATGDTGATQPLLGTVSKTTCATVFNDKGCKSLGAVFGREVVAKSGSERGVSNYPYSSWPTSVSKVVGVGVLGFEDHRT